MCCTHMILLLSNIMSSAGNFKAPQRIALLVIDPEETVMPGASLSEEVEPSENEQIQETV